MVKFSVPTQTMRFPEDLDLTRVKNRSFGTPNFSIKGRHIHTYFLFERARRDAGHDRVLFLKTPSFEGENDIASSMTRKIGAFFNRNICIYNENKA